MTGHDNGAYFFETAPSNLFCPNCETCLDDVYLPDNITIPKKYDIASSYDGRDIVSARFKEFCDENYPGQADFFPVTFDAKFFYIKPRQILSFDVEQRRTRFDRLCSICGSYKSITGKIPGVIKNQYEPIDRGIYRTDTTFGSGREKSFAIIVGLRTKDEIICKRFSKPSFSPIYDELPKPPS